MPLDITIPIPDEFLEPVENFLNSPDNTREINNPDGPGTIRVRIIPDLQTAIERAAQVKLTELARDYPTASVRSKLAQIAILQREIAQETTPAIVVSGTTAKRVTP